MAVIYGFGIVYYVALDRIPGPGYNTLLWRLIARHPIDSSTNYQAFKTPTFDNAWVPSKGGSLFHFMTVFGLMRAGCELGTIRMRGGHANH